MAIPLRGIRKIKYLILYLACYRQIHRLCHMCSLAILLTYNLNAQLSHPGFRHFTPENGLPSSTIFEIMQDSKSYIWYCTDNGVGRYNGYNFENFGPSNGLKESIIFHIMEDAKGKIWMQSMSGKIFYFENDSIHAFAGNNFIDQLHNKQDFAKGMVIDSIGQIYVSLSPLGLYRFSRNGQFDKIKTDSSFTVFQIQNQIIPVYQNYSPYYNIKNGADKYIFTLQSGNILSSFILQKPKIRSNLFETFYLKDKSIITYCGGNFFATNNKKIIWKLTKPYNVYEVFEDEKGFIYLGTDNGVEQYKDQANIKSGIYNSFLRGNVVCHILQDKNQGYWFATLQNGMFYCPNPEIEVYTEFEELHSKNISSIAIKNQHEIFIGFQDNRLVYLNSKTNEVKHFQHNKKQTFDLFFDNVHKDLWVGTPDILVFKNQKNIEFLKSKLIAGGRLLSKKFHFNNNANELWSCYHNGFSQIGIKNKSLEYNSENLLFDNLPYRGRTFDIFKSRDKKLWVANMNGLYELKNNLLSHFDFFNSALSSQINSIDELKDSTLVIGSNSYGLIFLKNNKIRILDESMGLSSNRVENIHIDRQNNIWIGTKNGLNKIKWTGNGNYKIEKITMSHGLPSNDIIDVESYGKDIWVGTSKGLAHFSNLAINKSAPKPIISFYLTGIKKLNETVINALEHFENNLTINFRAINYKMNGHILYSYSLNDNKPVITDNTSVSFQSLSPGEYSFNVSAQNEDGRWSEASLINFSILKPWWETNKARLIFILIVSGLIIWIFYIILKQTKKRYTIQMQIKELERSALQAQMNPHFIFNCLNSIQNYILQNEKDAAIQYLGAFASLVRSMLNASVAGKITLEEEIKLLNNYLSLEKLRFKNRFTYAIRTSENLDVFDIMIPPLLVQPYVENAIKHGISGQGYVEVIFTGYLNYIEVTITDTGLGFNNPNNESNTAFHKSFGMSITKKRLALNDKFSTVKTETIFNDLNEVKGAKVTLKIFVAEKITPKFQAR